MSQLISVMRTASDRYIDAYFTGVSTVVQHQQQFVEQAADYWFNALGAQSSGIGQLAEDYRAAQTEGAEAAKASARLGGRVVKEAGRTTSAAVASASDAASSATGTAGSGPAKWTSDVYDSLTAAEINEKLPQLSQHELAEVFTYENAHQARQTVLNRVTALQGDQPLADYDELNVVEIQKLLAAGDEKLAQRVRDYERPRKSREGVLQATDAKLKKP